MVTAASGFIKRGVCLRLAFCIWVLTVASVVFAQAARPEPAEEEREVARALMKEGRAAASIDDLESALLAFQRAHAIMAVPSTGAAVARTLAALGRLIEARKLATEVVAMPLDGQEPEALSRARVEAAELVRDLDVRIPSIEVLIRGVTAADVVLEIDGRSISESDRSKQIALDPGRHVLIAHANRHEARAEVQLAERDRRRIELAFERPNRVPHTLPPTAPQTDRAPSPSSHRTLGFIAGGIGLAGLAAVGVTGALLISRDDEIDRNCPDKHCNPRGRDLIEGSKTLAVINIAAWGVGIAGVGLGGYFLLVSDSNGARAGLRPPRAIAIHGSF